MATNFNGVIKLDVRDSKPDWTPFTLKKAPEGRLTCRNHRPLPPAGDSISRKKTD